MPKTVEEMTIAELMAVIERKRKIAKQIPKLRKEKEGILARLRQIDELLATAGPARGGGRKVAQPAAPAPKVAPVAAAKAPTPARRRRGAKAAIASVLGPKAMTVKEIAAALKAKGVSVYRKTLTVTLSKMSSANEIKRVGRGLYRQLGAMAAPAPAKAAAAPAGAPKMTVTERIVAFLAGAKRPVSSADIHKAIPDVSKNYIYNLLNALTKAKKVVHENAEWILVGAPKPAPAAPVKAPAAAPAAPKATPPAAKSGKTVRQRILEFLGATKDLHKPKEIRKTMPEVNSHYLYKILAELKDKGEIVHENGKWGLKLPA